jgi:Putative cyclase
MRRVWRPSQGGSNRPNEPGAFMHSKRWKLRPEGSNWGDFGADDQLGRLNLITPERRRRAAQEVREGLAFCLSLPLNCPSVELNPRRFPPVLSFSMRGQDPAINFPLQKVNPGQTDVVCDDRAMLSLQYSTQWDSLCHIGSLYDSHGSGEREVTYYNGYRAGIDVVGPFDYLKERAEIQGPYGARALGIETIAATALQARGVMIDLHAHVGLERVAVGYEALMRIIEADGVEVEPGDVLCFRTGFDRALLAKYANPDSPFEQHRCAGLDGFDPKLLRWISDCGAAGLVSDNEAVELLVDMRSIPGEGTRIPLHNLCLFKLGMPLGEMFLLSELADWLRSNRRFRFLFTAPPLRLPGAVGSPVTGVGTV